MDDGRRAQAGDKYGTNCYRNHGFVVAHGMFSSV